MPIRSSQIFLLAATFMLTVLSTGNMEASARGVKLSKKEMTDLLQLAFKMNQEADNDLYERMEKIINLMCEYKKVTGHFPQSPAEDEHFSRLAARILKNNPYEKSLVPDAPQPSPCKLNIIRDDNLNYASAQTWAASPPEQWRGAPGSIYLITNGENLLFSWGIGSSNIPIREPGQSHIRYCFQDSNARQAD